MMKISTALLIAAFACAGPALAQTAAPAPAAPAATSATPSLTKSGKPRAKEVRAQCRAESKAQGLKGAERKQATADCVIKQRPDLAAREKCKRDPQTKGMDKAARKAFIKDCVAKSKG